MSRKRVKWTPEEREALIKGVHLYGAGSWSEILNHFREIFQSCRTNVNLKDKWRNLKKNGLVNENRLQETNRGKKYYEILQLKPGASEKHIRRAYHAAALKYHPDKNKSANAEEKFAEIKEAYDKLSDPELRQQYERDQMSYEQRQQGQKRKPAERDPESARKRMRETARERSRDTIHNAFRENLSTQMPMTSQRGHAINGTGISTSGRRIFSRTPQKMWQDDHNGFAEENGDGVFKRPANVSRKVPHAEESKQSSRNNHSKKESSRFNGTPNQWTKSTLREMLSGYGYTLSELSSDRGELVELVNNLMKPDPMFPQAPSSSSEKRPGILSQGDIYNGVEKPRKVEKAHEVEKPNRGNEDGAWAPLPASQESFDDSIAASENMDPFENAWETFKSRAENATYNFKDRHTALCKEFFDHLIEKKFVVLPNCRD